MTSQELSQLHYLDREIEMDARRLRELERELHVTRWPDTIREIIDIIAAKRCRCITQRDSLKRYIGKFLLCGLLRA